MDRDKKMSAAFKDILVPGAIVRAKKIDFSDPEIKKRLDRLQQQQIASQRWAEQGRMWRRMFPVKR